MKNKKIRIINNADIVDFIFKEYLVDGSMVIADEDGNERIITNGDSILYDLE
jgi:hypothetical protein